MTRKRRKFDFRIMGIALIAIVVFIGLEIYNTQLNIPVGVGTTLIALFPGLLLVLMGLYTMKYSHSKLASGASMIGIGIGFAYLMGQANTEGLITVEMLSGLTVAQVQVWVIAFSVLFGGIIAVYK